MSIWAESRAERAESSPSDREYSEKCYIAADLPHGFKRKNT